MAKIPKILVVEDDLSAQVAAEAMIGRAFPNCEIIIVPDAEEADKLPPNTLDEVVGFLYDTESPKGRIEKFVKKCKEHYEIKRIPRPPMICTSAIDPKSNKSSPEIYKQLFGENAPYDAISSKYAPRTLIPALDTAFKDSPYYDRAA